MYYLFLNRVCCQRLWYTKLIHNTKFTLNATSERQIIYHLWCRLIMYTEALRVSCECFVYFDLIKSSYVNHVIPLKIISCTFTFLDALYAVGIKETIVMTGQLFALDSIYSLCFVFITFH